LLLATKADPENEELLHVLGSFYTSTRRFDEVEKLYQDLLKKNPHSIVAKKRLVEIYFNKNERKQAKQYIEDILKAKPTDNDACFFVAGYT
jgi:predicted Zn-dependent protease